MDYTKRDKNTLATIPNRIQHPFQSKHICKEVTYEGSVNQPDFCELIIDITYQDKMIELKSLKRYIQSWRNIHVSYERFVECVYNDITEVYNPIYLKITLNTNPRGGISTEVTMTSKSE